MTTRFRATRDEPETNPAKKIGLSKRTEPAAQPPVPGPWSNTNCYMEGSSDLLKWMRKSLLPDIPYVTGGRPRVIQGAQVRHNGFSLGVTEVYPQVLMATPSPSTAFYQLIQNQRSADL